VYVSQGAYLFFCVGFPFFFTAWQAPLPHRVLQLPPHGPTWLVRNGRQLERRANQR